MIKQRILAGIGAAAATGLLVSSVALAAHTETGYDGYDYRYVDGEYGTVVSGYSQNLVVIVTVKDGVVDDVVIKDDAEEQGADAIAQLPAAIVEADGTRGVDAVSGATVTSDAILAGAEASLERARIHTSRGASVDARVVAEHEAAEAAGYEDGNYLGYSENGEGFVVVVYKGGQIAACITLAHSGDADTEELEEFCHAFVGHTTADDVEEAAEAQGEFAELLEAIEDCIAQAKM